MFARTRQPGKIASQTPAMPAMRKPPAIRVLSPSRTVIARQVETGDDDPLKKNRATANGSDIPTPAEFKAAFLSLKLPPEHPIQSLTQPPKSSWIEDQMPKKFDIGTDELPGIPKKIEDVVHPEMGKVTGKTEIKALGSLDDGKIGAGASVATPLSPLVEKVLRFLRRRRKKHSSQD